MRWVFTDTGLRLAFPRPNDEGLEGLLGDVGRVRHLGEETFKCFPKRLIPNDRFGSDVFQPRPFLQKRAEMLVERFHQTDWPF